MNKSEEQKYVNSLKVEVERLETEIRCLMDKVDTLKISCKGYEKIIREYKSENKKLKNVIK